MLSQITLIALATSALALQITSPTKNELWDLSKSQTIKWNAVNTDPSTFDIYLAHMASHPPSYTLLTPNINKDAGSFEVTGLQLPLGETYQINFVAHDKPEQIYAQSQQFNLTGEAVAATSTLDGYTGPTYTPSAGAASNTASTVRTTLSTLTTTSGSATITQTSTGTVTEAASATESDADVTESGSRTATGAGSATSAAATASRTPNAAVGNGASAPLAALVFGVAAFFL